MINVSIVHSPPRPVGDWPESVNSANMFELRVNGQYVQAFVDEDDAKAVKQGLDAALAKTQSPLEQIANLWPDPGMCAEIAPEYVGPNDGRVRADLLWEALNIARKATGKPTYPRPEHWR